MTPGAARRSFTLLSLGAYVILGTHTFDSAAFFAIIYIREAHAPFQIRYDFQISGIHRVFCFFLVVRPVVCGLTAVVVFCAAPADAGRLDLYSAVSSSECSNLHR